MYSINVGFIYIIYFMELFKTYMARLGLNIPESYRTTKSYSNFFFCESTKSNSTKLPETFGTLLH